MLNDVCCCLLFEGETWNATFKTILSSRMPYSRFSWIWPLKIILVIKVGFMLCFWHIPDSGRFPPEKRGFCKDMKAPTFTIAHESWLTFRFQVRSYIFLTLDHMNHGFFWRPVASGKGPGDHLCVLGICIEKPFFSPLKDGILPEWCFQSFAISQSNDLQEHYRHLGFWKLEVGRCSDG